MTFALLGSRGLFGGFRDSPVNDIVFTRDAGVWARRSAPILNGTTFIQYFTGHADIPRMCYFDGAWLMAIGPARTNLLPYGNFADAGADGIPDGWAHGNGVAGVDYTSSQTGGPHGAVYWQKENTASAGGVEDDVAIASGTTYTWSAWVRAPAALAGGTLLFVFQYGVASYASITLPESAAFDWTLMSVTQTSSHTSSASNTYMQIGANPGGVVQVALPTLEAATYPSLCPIPSQGGLVSKPLEILTLPSAALGVASGRIRIGVFLPAYAYDDFATVHRIVSISEDDYLCYDGADDSFKVYNAGVMRAQSATQSFARRSANMLDFQYGTFGTRLVVNGITYRDTTAWTQVGVPVGSIGGTPVTGALTEEAAYGDVEIWSTWP